MLEDMTDEPWLDVSSLVLKRPSEMAVGEVGWASGLQAAAIRIDGESEDGEANLCVFFGDRGESDLFGPFRDADWKFLTCGETRLRVAGERRRWDADVSTPSILITSKGPLLAFQAGRLRMTAYLDLNTFELVGEPSHIGVQQFTRWGFWIGEGREAKPIITMLDGALATPVDRLVPVNLKEVLG
jgi:hypothetical protein